MAVRATRIALRRLGASVRYLFDDHSDRSLLRSASGNCRRSIVNGKLHFEPASAARIAAPMVAPVRAMSSKGADMVIELSSYLESRISSTSTESATQYAEVGKVISVGDGIARVYGLANVQAGEMVVFDSGCVPPSRRQQLGSSSPPCAPSARI
jgi:hypothetical protein